MIFESVIGSDGENTSVGARSEGAGNKKDSKKNKIKNFFAKASKK